MATTTTDNGPADLRLIFRDNVRRRMEAAGLSQTELAIRLKVTQSSISQLLAGKRNPSLETVARVAAVLDVAPEMLLTKV